MKSAVCAATLSGSVIRLGASVLSRPGCGKSITSGGLPPCEQDGCLDLELVGALEVDLDARAVDERLPEVGEDLDGVGIVLAVADR